MLITGGVKWYKFVGRNGWSNGILGVHYGYTHVTTEKATNPFLHFRTVTVRKTSRRALLIAKDLQFAATAPATESWPANGFTVVWSKQNPSN